jgi:hypothetical protein
MPCELENTTEAEGRNRDVNEFLLRPDGVLQQYEHKPPRIQI